MLVTCLRLQIVRLVGPLEAYQYDVDCIRALPTGSGQGRMRGLVGFIVGPRDFNHPIRGGHVGCGKCGFGVG